MMRLLENPRRLGRKGGGNIMFQKDVETCFLNIYQHLY